VQYSLDQANGEAHVERQWTDPDAVLSTPTLGDVRPFAGGNVLTNWGIMGRAAVISPAGGVLWDLQLDPRAALGGGDALQSFYGNEPTTPG